MGLNVNVLRRFMLPQDIKKKEENNKESGGGINTKQPQNPPSSAELELIKQNLNTLTYFEVYNHITSQLGDFYSETLAKMTGTEVLNKRMFSSLYNTTLNNVIKEALEKAQAGEELDYIQLAQSVKDKITSELEACNYDSVQYTKNQIDKNINETYSVFKE